MTKVIDFYLDLPNTPQANVDILRYIGRDDSMIGYRRAFGQGIANAIGLDVEELKRIYETQGDQAFDDTIRQACAKIHYPTMEEFIQQMDEDGVEFGFTSDGDHNNRAAAELCLKYPDRLGAFFYADCLKGMDEVREFEYCVKELNTKALYISAFRTLLPANDRRYYPLYAKAVELGVPVFIYSALNFSGTIPMNVGHFSYIDEIAHDFPEMKIMVTMCFPWTTEYVALAVRHKNVYLNLEVMDYAEMNEPGSEMSRYLYYLKDKRRDLSKKMCFASNSNFTAVSVKETIRRVQSLPLPDEMIENILYHNGRRFLDQIPY